MPILRKDFDKPREYSTGAKINDLKDGEALERRLGKASLLANRECNKYNIGKYRTDPTGYITNVETGLNPTQPTKLKFQNEIIRIDKADYKSYWQFTCGLAGIYQVNLDLELLFSGADGDTIEDYIKNEGNRAIYIYVNGATEMPPLTGFNNNQYQFDGVYYHYYLNGSTLIELKASDIMDLRNGYLAESFINAVTIITKGDLSLFWIGEK